MDNTSEKARFISQIKRVLDLDLQFTALLQQSSPGYQINNHAKVD